jgi:hypothetical protein
VGKLGGVGKEVDENLAQAAGIDVVDALSVADVGENINFFLPPAER